MQPNFKHEIETLKTMKNKIKPLIRKKKVYQAKLYEINSNF